MYMFYAWSGALFGFASHMSRCQTNCPLYGSSWNFVEPNVGLNLVGAVLTVSFQRVLTCVAPMMRWLMLTLQIFYEFSAEFASTTPLNAKRKKVFTPGVIANSTRMQAPQPSKWCFICERKSNRLTFLSQIMDISAASISRLASKLTLFSILLLSLPVNCD